MPDFKKFSIDSTLELVADHFTAEVNGSDVFVQASPVDRVDFTLGILDGTQVKTISQIKQGVIDEYELTITPKNISGTIRGRDPSALILDRYFKKRYVRLPAPTVVSEVVPTIGAIPEVQGRFTMAEIAAEVVGSVGLTLSFETINYELLATFEAVGRVVDILRNLIRPWTHVEPFRTDIYLVDQTVILRQRPFPVVSPTYTLTLDQIRRNQLTIRRRATRKVGILTLRGAQVAAALTDDPDNALTGGFLNLFLSGEQTEEETQENFAPPGQLQSIITTVSVFRMPSHVLLRSTKTEFTRDGNGLIMKTREKITNNWQSVPMDSSGPQGQPKQLDSLITRERIDQSDPSLVFRHWDTEEIGYSYDGNGFETGETTRLRTLDLGNNVFVDAKMTIKTLRPKGSLLVEQITTDYTFNTDEQRFEFDKRNTQTQGGFPPGGPGRGIPVSRGEGGQPNIGGSRQIELITQLSADADAEDIEISDSNLSLANLQTILNQFAAAQGLIEWEQSFSGIGMPFIQRGKTVGFIGVFDENGIPIQLPAGIITEVRSNYSEGTGEGNSHYLIDARLFAWGAP